MALFMRALGKAAEIDPSGIEVEFMPLLMPGEAIKKVCKYIRDYWVFTSKRVVMVKKHGVFAKKVAYHSIPYKSIFRFSIETAGHTDIDQELKIWVAGMPKPFEIKFDRFFNIYEVQTILAAPLVK
jgi:hypothetical protein